MAMAALERQAKAASMTRDEWQRVENPWRIVAAAQQDEAARDAAVWRIIDTCLDLQLVRRHDKVGYQPFSVTGNVPMPGSGKTVDQCMLAAQRYRPESEWHRACAWLLGRLPKRQAAAMLMQAARGRPDRLGHSQWAVTARQMVERQEDLLQLIGYRSVYLMPGQEELEAQHAGLSEKEIERLTKATAIRPFESVRALQECAARARRQLRKWLESGETQHVDEVRG